MSKKLMLLWVASLSATAWAAPSAYVENALEAFYAYPHHRVGFAVEKILEESSLPVDVAIEARVGMGLEHNTFNAELAAKALIFPSLSLDPPLAVAARADVGFGSNYWGIHAGPLVSLDYNPVTLNAGVYLGGGSGGFQVNYNAGFRYYWETAALDVSVVNSKFVVGLRLFF